MGNSGTEGSPGPALRPQDAGLSCLRITSGDLSVAWPPPGSKLVRQGALLDTPTPPRSPGPLGLSSPAPLHGVPSPLSLWLSPPLQTLLGSPFGGFSLRLPSPGRPGRVGVWRRRPVPQDLCASSESRSLMTQSIPFPARQQKTQVVNHLSTQHLPSWVRGSSLQRQLGPFAFLGLPPPHRPSCSGNINTSHFPQRPWSSTVLQNFLQPWERLSLCHPQQWPPAPVPWPCLEQGSPAPTAVDREPRGLAWGTQGEEPTAAHSCLASSV